jgi:protein-S-isoprenylcysteine O-methyltransferase Ste14
VRNPMYLALITAVLGQAMIFNSLALLLYALALWVITAAFVRWYEEPVEVRRYGDDYQRYRRAVRPGCRDRVPGNLMLIMPARQADQ